LLVGWKPATASGRTADAAGGAGPALRGAPGAVARRRLHASLLHIVEERQAARSLRPSERPSITASTAGCGTREGACNVEKRLDAEQISDRATRRRCTRGIRPVRARRGGQSRYGCTGAGRARSLPA